MVTSTSVERRATKAIQIETFGSPAEVVKAVDIPEIGAPRAGKVVIALEAVPINQYDLLMIAGGYATGHICRPSWVRTGSVASSQWAWASDI
jgi:NADPH:quinone reductase-like Zn-dependent oxidoreductase